MSPSPNDAGFTLIELLVTLAVMALVSVLLLPMLTSRSQSRTEMPANAMMRMLAAARLDAARTKEDRPIALVDGVQWTAGFPAGSRTPTFHADGTAAGGALVLANGQSIIISWIDGHATLSR